MAIKIDIQKPEIDVEIGGLNFVYKYTDDAQSKLEKNRQAMIKKLSEHEVKENDPKNTERLREMLREGFDMLLGEGSFDKLFELVNSSIILAGIFVEVNLGIDDELNKRNAKISAKAKASKYTRSKEKAMKVIEGKKK